MPRRPPPRLLSEFLRQSERAVTPTGGKKRKKNARRQNRTIKRVRETAEPKFRRAFRDAVEATKKATRLGELEAAITRSDLAAAADAVPWQDVGVPRLKAGHANALLETVRKAGIVTAEPLGAKFDVLDRRTLDFMETRSTQFIREFGGMSPPELRQALADMVSEGLSVRDAARGFRDELGLTQNLKDAVTNYRTKLEAKGYKAERIERLVEAKRRQLLEFRSRNVARTEAQDSATFGQQEAWRQAESEGLIDADFLQEWVTTSNPCPKICDPADGQRRKLGEPFTLGDGRQVAGPSGAAHVNCLCTLVAVRAGEEEAA